MKAATEETAGYQIRVRGLLDAQWSEWLDGAGLSYEGQVTVLTCPGADQAALHGLLRRLYALGVPLISVHPLEG